MKQRSLPLLIEEKADGVHQNEAQQAIAQMPQIPCPDPLHLTTIRQLTKDRVDEITNPSQDRTLLGCRLWRVRFAKRRLGSCLKAFHLILSIGKCTILNDFLLAEMEIYIQLRKEIMQQNAEIEKTNPPLAKKLENLDKNLQTNDDSR